MLTMGRNPACSVMIVHKEKKKRNFFLQKILNSILKTDIGHLRHLWVEYWDDVFYNEMKNGIESFQQIETNFISVSN